MAAERISAYRRGDAWHPDWTGSESDVHLGPVQGVPVQVNATEIVK